ncbi:hypothetical protein NNO07_11705, partial [Pseudomonas resinovorans]
SPTIPQIHPILGGAPNLGDSGSLFVATTSILLIVAADQAPPAQFDPDQLALAGWWSTSS